MLNPPVQVRRPRLHGQPTLGFFMRKPGALHHARFLASCLYLMKMAMLRDVLPAGILTPRMKEKVIEVAEYIALFHAPHFLQARIASVAPRLDLELWQLMSIYRVNISYFLNPKQLHLLQKHYDD